MQSKHDALFKEKPVWQAIAAMAVPAMISMVVMIAYNMADMFFVARLGNDALVAAVSLSGSVFTVMMALGSMISGGGCVLIAQTLGKGDRESQALYSSACCWGSLAFGGVFAALVFLLKDPLLSFLGTNVDTYTAASSYVTVLALGAPVMIFVTGFGGCIRAEGAVKEGVLGHFIGTVANIILDPIFILWFHMGVQGAAIATVLGNALGAVYVIWYVHNKKSTLTMRLTPILRRPQSLGRVVSLGLPNAVSSILAGFASAFANQLLVRYGTEAVAAMGAAGKATLVISMVQMGLCMGVQPMLAYSYGARDLNRLRETLVKLGILTVSVGAALTLLCFFNSQSIIALFLKETSSLALGQRMVRLLVSAGPFLGLFYLSSSLLQTSGKAALATFVSALRQGILLVPMLFVMNRFFGVTGNIWAHVAADISSALTASVFALRQYRKLMNLDSMT